MVKEGHPFRGRWRGKNRNFPPSRGNSSDINPIKSPTPPRTPEDMAPEERRIFSIAEESYLRALQSYHSPSLPDPVFLFDYSRQTGFFINNETWQITLNLANTPAIHLDHEFLDYFYALSMHEIGHYDYCPYDGLTNLRLIAAAIEGGSGKYYAPVVVNIFSDLLIDTRLFEQKPTLMMWEFQKETEDAIHYLNGRPPSLTWRLLTRCYEIMWNKKLAAQVDCKEVEKEAQAICRIINADRELESTWQSKVKRIAKIMKPLLKEECKMAMKQQMNAPTLPSEGQQTVDVSDLFDQEDMEELGEMAQTSMNPSSYSGSQPLSSPQNTSSNPIAQPDQNQPTQPLPPNLGQVQFVMPDDVLRQFGDLTEIKNLDLVKCGDAGKNPSGGPGISDSMIPIAESLALDTRYRDFADTMNLNGMNDSRNIQALWYRGKAKDLIQIRMFVKKAGGALPAYPVTWRVGDPVEELDFLQTLLVSPQPIPNITTRKWVNKEGPGPTVEKAIPDLLVVIDSSGSMDMDFSNNTISGRYHMALLASFAAVHYALRKGSYVAAINFSSFVRVQNWTNDPLPVEKLLLTHQNDSTVLPTTQIISMLKKAKKECLVVIISDLELGNWGPAKQAFLEIMQMKNKLVGFFIGGNPASLDQPELKELMFMGARFYCINNIDDLCGLVIKEVKSAYDSGE